MRKTNKWLAISLVFSMIYSSKTMAQDKIIYQSKDFTLYNHKVVQGDYEAKALDNNTITSNYQSTASKVFSRKIEFKFAINEKDIEMPSGKNHTLIIGSEHQSPVIVFGNQQVSGQDAADKYLPENYAYTFRLDFRPVLKQFEEKGFYTAADGTRIAKSDFKDVCIAGGAFPLSWDFSNLEEKNLILQDKDGDGIYEITLTLNPVNHNESSTKQWKLSKDISQKPQYSSSQPLVDALFRMSTEESQMNIEADRTFRTGAKWGGVWTRDISYSILLAFAYLQPEEAKISLMKKVKRNRIIQDTGSGGAWPISSDRTTWALAAWEVYKATGDKEWLKNSFQIIKNTLDDDARTLYDAHTGMYRGESSFLDWREQTYPKWMDNRDIFVSENLGTNIVHYQAHQILVHMGKLLGIPTIKYEKQAEKIKKGVNQWLWQPGKGYYAQYLYGRNTELTVSPRFEALGEALAVIFDVADADKAKEIIAKSPLTAYGTTCIYPQIPNIPPYHNNAVWPFVQSYFNLAAAKVGNETVLNYGLAAIYRPAALFLTNYENFVAQNGDYVGTEINSDRMLWSMAGNLSTVYRILMGINFGENGILFQPAVPKGYDGDKILRNFKYQNAVLDITVKGFGHHIQSFLLDGKANAKAFFSNTISGKHTVEIILDNKSFEGASHPQENHFSLPNPTVKLENKILIWENVTGAKAYKIYQNTELLATTTHLQYPVNTAATYKVSAVDALGYESFTSEPIHYISKNSEKIVEIEQFASPSKHPYINFSGAGFVEISLTQNKEITFKTTAAARDYLISFRYANGNGPWNTDNKCAIRSLYVNGNYQGVLVMPQRGLNEWSDWGDTNTLKVSLQKGENKFKIKFEDWNNNMNVEVNTAMLDYMKITPVK